MHKLYINIFKPASDMMVACLLMVILSPVFLITFLLLLLSNRGKVLFTQTRLGKDNKPFTIYKFKTMTDERDEKGMLLEDKLRQTPIGNTFRYLHLDELPQLINIIKGELAIIGPRPLLPEYLSYYSSRQKIRHLVKPGIIGLSQVMGGNSLTWPQRLRLDSFYAEHCSPRLDFKILIGTVGYFFKRRRARAHIFSKSFIEEIQKD